MHVEDAGTGPVVLALHGLGGGAWFFSGLARRLEPGYRTLAVDLPGTGRSLAPAPAGPDVGDEAASAGMREWVAALGTLVEGLGAPVVILGHSMGTILALEIWRAWPQHVRALIFAGGLPEPLPAIRARLEARAAGVARDGMDGVGRQVAEANFGRATLERQPELVAMFARLFDAQDAAAYVRCCHVLRHASAAAIVPEVAVPCLAISGGEDRYAPPDLVSAFMQRLPVPGREVVLPDCGHYPFLEAPAAFAAAVRSFLETVW